MTPYSTSTAPHKKKMAQTKIIHFFILESIECSYFSKMRDGIMRAIGMSQ